jgi:hypothetical protein
MCLLFMGFDDQGVVLTMRRFSRRRLLAARRWFANNGPPDAPPLPLSYNEREDLKRGSGFPRMVAYYALSLEGVGYAVEVHPSFDDYACGVMASDLAHSLLTDDEELRRRYPPRPLPGLGAGLCWEPPEWGKTARKGRRRKARKSDNRAAVRQSFVGRGLPNKLRAGGVRSSCRFKPRLKPHASKVRRKPWRVRLIPGACPWNGCEVKSATTASSG